jgi:hypothetical protein
MTSKHTPATPLPWRSSHPMKIDDRAEKCQVTQGESE